MAVAAGEGEGEGEGARDCELMGARVVEGMVEEPGGVVDMLGMHVTSLMEGLACSLSLLNSPEEVALATADAVLACLGFFLLAGAWFAEVREVDAAHFIAVWVGGPEGFKSFSGSSRLELKASLWVMERAMLLSSLNNATSSIMSVSEIGLNTMNILT